MKRITKRTIRRQPDTLLNSELNYVFGLPGSGKSTLLAAVAQCAYEQGIPCYSTYPIRHAYKWQGFDCQYPVGSVFLLDEIYDFVGSGTNRGILPPDVAMWFKMYRHSRYTVWACSQEADDVARRVRGIVTQAWEITSRGSVSVLRRAEIREVKDVDGEKYILQDEGIISALLHDIILVRRHFYDDFDSYARREYKRFATFEQW